MFARFDENPAMTLQVIKKKNVTDGRTHARTDNVKTVYPTTKKFAGGGGGGGGGEGGYYEYIQFSYYTNVVHTSTVCKLK